jgi:hypothetical protein
VVESKVREVSELFEAGCFAGFAGCDSRLKGVREII